MHMISTILATKLYIPPTRSELVPRPRLIEVLNEGLHRKLTLISAPAGFGKTTLVSEWLQLCNLSTTWLSLDEGDNDLTRFLVYFISALQQITPDIGQTAKSMLQSPQSPPAETLITMLINEITASFNGTGCVFVLDDYHLIEIQAIHNALTFLLEHLPPRMHLVIVGRADPPLPLSRLRSRGQITEIRADDLRFAPAEAAAFLGEVMGLTLSEAEVAVLETRTEGWIAGLQLAALSMQGSSDISGFINSFTGNHRYIIDYLTDEVLHRQPPETQEFLLQTSILERMSASLCNAVTGREDGQTTLDRLEKGNLFLVPLDNERRWYRYHHLFADLLRQRLHQTLPEQALTLDYRASAWYEQNEFTDEAIDHALNGKHFERAAYLIEDQFGDNYERGDQTLLRRWLAEIPEEFVFSRPRLCVLHAWNLFSFGQLDAADRRLQVAEKMLDPNAGHSSLDKDQLSDTNKMKLVGRVAAIRSFLVSYSGDIPGTIRYARQALEYLPEQELEWRSAALIALGDAYASQGQMVAAHKARSDALVTGKASGDIYILIIVNSSLAEVLRQQGKLQQVIDICERQLKRADERGISESELVGWLLGIWGEVLAELNDLDRALDKAKKGVKLAARGRDVIHIGLSNLYLVRVLFSSGDITGAEDVIQLMENTARECDLPFRASLQLSAWQVRIWLVQGKLDAASQWVEEHELDPEEEPTYLNEMEYIVFARILIAQERLDEATLLLQRLLEAAETGGRTSSVIEILILQALAAQSGGDTARAMSTLEGALTLAEPGGFIRIFIDEGIPMAGLLSELSARGIMLKYTDRLLAAFNDEVQRSRGENSAPCFPPSQPLVEPLTLRELEVLGLIAEGLSNPEICDKLFIALDTVKGHNRKIFGKLGVENRARAIIKARDLNILPPQ